MMPKYQRTTKKDASLCLGALGRLLGGGRIQTRVRRWIILCATDPEEKKDAGGRMI